jgi:hypothetical protein
MRALTIRQPWATLIAEGVKTIETRSWSTKHRGPIAIHAGKHPQDYSDFMLSVRTIDAVKRSGSGCARCGCAESLHVCCFTHTECWCRRCDGWQMPALPLGAVVATANLVDCIPTEAMWHCDIDQWANDDEDAEHLRLAGYGYAAVADSWWVATDQLPFGDFAPGRWAWLLDDIQPCEPIPAKGRQGLWEWTP